MIEKLREDIQFLKAELGSRVDRDVTLRHHNDLTSSVDMLHHQPSSRTSLSRPYSSYIDLNDIDDSASLHQSEESTSDLCSKSEATVLPEKKKQSQHATEVGEGGLERGKRIGSSAKWSQKYVLTKNGHSGHLQSTKT